jgi:hypothetical protein
MTLYDNRPMQFFSATMEFRGDSKAGLSASTQIPEQAFCDGWKHTAEHRPQFQLWHDHEGERIS